MNWNHFFKTIAAAAWLLAAAGFAAAQSQLAQDLRARPAAGTSIAKLKANGLACPGCNLSGYDFSNRVIEGVNFTRTNLAGANFSGATLRGVALTDANLVGANFSGARIETGKKGRTTFTRADLSQVNFTGARMAGADLQYAKMSCAASNMAASAGAVVGYFNPSCTASNPSIRAVVDASWSCPNTDLADVSALVYVSTSGQDSASCGQSASTPCQTIAQGLSQCTGSSCGVLVYYGVYSASSPIALGSSKRIYGGCVVGTSANTNFSVLDAPPGGLPAITANGATSTLIQGLNIIGSDVGVANGAPSIAVSISGNSNVTLSHVTLTAGTGGTGTVGSSGASGSQGSGGNGQSAGTNAQCSTNGGQGGVGMTTNVSYSMTKVTDCPNNCSSNSCNGYPGASAGASAGAGGGRPGAYCQLQCISSCPSNLTGYTGVAGVSGACGAGGTASGNINGSYVNGVWQGSSGASGIAGMAGGGGGGGGGGAACGYVCFWVSDNKSGAAGGGGGAGSCGAGAGTGGQQGGASIALQVVQSSVILGSLVAVQAGMGGAGGNGGANGAAMSGGSGGGGSKPSGASPLAGNGGWGGVGGWGGSSGAGAGGNGGPSFGIVFVSTPQANIGGTVIHTGYSGNVGQVGSTAANPAGAPCQSSQGATGMPGRVTDYISFN